MTVLAARTLVTAVAVSFAASWCLYWTSRLLSMWLGGRAYQRMPRDEKAAWDTRMVSSVHASVTLVGAVIAMLAFDHADRAAMVRGSTATMELVVAGSLGYFLQDLIVIMYERGALWVVPDLVHHCVVIVSYTLCLSQQTFLFYNMWALLGELSTPFLNLRWFAEKVQRPRRWIDLLFVASFTLSRPLSLPLMLWSAVVNYRMWEGSTAAHVQFTLGVVMTLLNLYWAAIIVGTAVSVLFPDRSHKAAKAA